MSVWYHLVRGGIIAVMAMTLRPTDAEHAAIAEAAEREGKSMQRFILDAALEAARGRTRRRDELLATILREDAEALDRLGNS